MLILGLSAKDETSGPSQPAPAASAYSESPKASLVPLRIMQPSCSIFRLGVAIGGLGLAGLIAMFFGSCSTAATGSSGGKNGAQTENNPARRAEDPFTTMNGYGDRVY